MADCSDSISPLHHDCDNSTITNVIGDSGLITVVITIADRLKSAREAAAMTQGELAAKAGVTQGTIANVEGGIRKNPRELLAIARALNVSAEWLKSGKGTRSPEQDAADDAINGVQDTRPDYMLGSKTGRHAIAYHVGQIGRLLSDVDEVRRSAIAEMLGAVARKPHQADEVAAHIQALVDSKAKRSA